VIFDRRSPEGGIPGRQFWFRVVGIGMVVVLIGFVFLHLYPRAWRVACRPIETRSTDPTGRNISTVTFSCLPISWYYIAAFCGAAFSAIITLRRVTAVRLVMFIVIADLLIAWIAGMTLLVWDHYLPHIDLESGPAVFWVSLLLFAAMTGIIFGNIFTLGFPVWAPALALFCVLGGERALRRKA
jgi:hypothetical protein